MTDTYTPGQIIWLSPGGNYASMYKHVSLPVRATVKSVKRKYFYAVMDDSDKELAFDRTTGIHEADGGNATWTAWLSKRAYLDEQERRQKLQVVRIALNQYEARYGAKPCLDDVRAMYDILKRAGLVPDAQSNTTPDSR